MVTAAGLPYLRGPVMVVQFAAGRGVHCGASRESCRDMTLSYCRYARRNGRTRKARNGQRRTCLGHTTYVNQQRLQHRTAASRITLKLAWISVALHRSRLAGGRGTPNLPADSAGRSPSPPSGWRLAHIRNGCACSPGSGAMSWPLPSPRRDALISPALCASLGRCSPSRSACLRSGVVHRRLNMPLEIHRADVIRCSPGDGRSQSRDQIRQAWSASSLRSMVAAIHGPSSICTSTLAMGAPHACPMMRY